MSGRACRFPMRSCSLVIACVALTLQYAAGENDACATGQQREGDASAALLQSSLRTARWRGDTVHADIAGRAEPAEAAVSTVRVAHADIPVTGSSSLSEFDAASPPPAHHAQARKNITVIPDSAAVNAQIVNTVTFEARRGATNEKASLTAIQHSMTHLLQQLVNQQRLGLSLTEAWPIALLVGCLFVFVLGGLMMMCIVGFSEGERDRILLGESVPSGMDATRRSVTLTDEPAYDSKAQSAQELYQSGGTVESCGSNCMGMRGLARTPPLCPELLVPGSTECTLLVPRIQFGAAKEDQTFYVQDDWGGNLFRLTLEASVAKEGESNPRGRTFHRQSRRSVSSTSSSQPSVRARHVSLSSAAGEIYFASVSLTATASGDPSVSFTNKANDAHGHLSMVDETKQGRQFLVNFASGDSIHLYSDGARSAYNVQAGDGQLLAIMERPAAHDKRPSKTVVVGSGADAGLVVLSRVGIDWIQFAQSQTT